jgi:subtilisin family serine protease
MRVFAAALVSVLCGAALLPAQDRPWAFKLRPLVQVKMQRAKPRDLLPVYFVIGDRLGYHHWFPRVESLDVDQRRALVVRELMAHARKTQARVLAQLRAEHDAGEAHAPSGSWLGNFVQVHATAAAIDRVAALDEVWDVWYDEAPPLAHVEDALPAPVSAGILPGNGPAAVRADRVWALGIFGNGVTVMNADSGINVQHAALQNNLWTNPGEIAGNGIDDDGNGFIDDVHGWNFAAHSSNLDDFGSHGTQTAGVLVGDGACGPYVGIAPLGYVMTGVLSDETSQWQAIQYAILMGAHVQTSSHSYKNDFVPPPNYEMHRDIAELSLAAGLIRTNSTSNNGAQCEGLPTIARPFNIAAPGNVPPPYLDPNQLLVGRKGGVIGVGAHNLFGLLDPQSPCGPSAWNLSDLLAVVPTYPLANWDPNDDDYPWLGGAQMALLKPDVVAPTGTTTTVGGGPTCALGAFGGTSNATPIVAGCIMLWKSANMSLTPEDVAMIIHQTSVDAGSVPGKENTWGAGRIDAYAGLERALCVHRINGEPAWEVMHQGGRTLTFEIDGSPNRPALIAVGLERKTFAFGPIVSGIGATLFPVFVGSTGPTGSVQVDLAVAPVPQPFTVYSQVFLDDTQGPTKRVLTSNVIGIRVVP